MNPYTNEYKRLQMRLDSVRADLKRCSFIGNDWKRLDRLETNILRELAK